MREELVVPRHVGVHLHVLEARGLPALPIAIVGVWVVDVGGLSCVVWGVRTGGQLLDSKDTQTHTIYYIYIVHTHKPHHNPFTHLPGDGRRPGLVEGEPELDLVAEGVVHHVGELAKGVGRVGGQPPAALGWGGWGGGYEIGERKHVCMGID